MNPRTAPLHSTDIFTLNRANILPWASVLVGVTLRVVLATVNRQANDDHVEVVLELLGGGRQPTILTCNECFQPKLYHLMCAWIAKACDLSTRDQITVVAQLFNAVLGIGVVLIGYGLICRISENRLVRFLATSWLALNPGLLGINVQATNDTLLIFVGTVLLVSLHDWIGSGTRSATALGVAVLSAGLAPHIKGNGIVLALLTAAIVSAITWQRSSPHRVLRSIAVLVLLTVVVLMGARVNRSYQDNYQATGLLLPTNMVPAPTPFLVRHTVANRPGVTSIASAFLTFRIVDLVQTPYNMEGVEPHSLHRTSLWSQLYARTYVLHFDQWPPSWKRLSPDVLVLGRVLLLLGLLPTWLLLTGLADFVRRPRQSNLESFVFFLFVVAMLAFMVAYSVRYRDVAVMKVIFILPAVVAFMYFYVHALRDRITRPSWRASIVLAHVAMLGLWVLEAVHLALQLRAYP